MRLLRLLFQLAILASLASCASNWRYLSPCIDNPDYDYKDLVTVVNKAQCFSKEAFINKPITKAIQNVNKPEKKPVVAIYKFEDATGQRKSVPGYADFSTALTQAPIDYVIRAIKQSDFFRIVEREGLDHLVRERQIIKSSRKDFDDETKQLPLLFAGLIVEGSVVDYNTNLKSGGIGARYLGIGTSKQYTEDTVVVSLRIVSVSTGEILLETLSSKTVLSVMMSGDVFRYIAESTELIEFETGNAMNESKAIALQAAIELAVVDLIKQGIEKGYWKYE